MKLIKFIYEVVYEYLHYPIIRGSRTLLEHIYCCLVMLKKNGAAWYLYADNVHKREVTEVKNRKYRKQKKWDARK